MPKMKPKSICNDHYLLYPTGKIVRNKPARGTHIGKVLKPYKASKQCVERYVNLYYDDWRWQVSINELLWTYFGIRR